MAITNFQYFFSVHLYTQSMPLSMDSVCFCVFINHCHMACSCFLAQKHNEIALVNSTKYGMLLHFTIPAKILETPIYVKTNFSPSLPCRILITYFCNRRQSLQSQNNTNPRSLGGGGGGGDCQIDRPPPPRFQFWLQIFAP